MSVKSPSICHFYLSIGYFIHPSLKEAYSTVLDCYILNFYFYNNSFHLR